MQTELIIQNPHASMPLRMLIGVEANTPTDRILANMRENAVGRGGWVKMLPAHDRVAVLCGSGPSLADSVRDIANLGGDIFALNGAAKFLAERGVVPDYQVILDARPSTLSLVGPARAHLFASQVDPSLFEARPAAILWHATHGDIAPEFPEYEDDYCMIGGAISVGNAALVLAYVLGYRKMECFGYDSSHRDGKGHAFRQSLNDGDPTTLVEFGGKEYVSSLTMRLQASYFMERSRALKAEGCEIRVHGDGLLPAMYNAPPMSEAQKYCSMWNVPAYRAISPGELVVPRFMELAKPNEGSSLIDFGCGTGRAGAALAKLGLDVLLVDFAPNCRDPGVNLQFTVADLTKPIGLKADYGFCCDVMEHLPTEDVERVIANIMACVPRAFFQVSLVHDEMGSHIGEPLHLTVKPFSWWREKFEPYGILAAFDEGASAIFYVHSTT